jgi:hypothetical protein
MQEKRKSQILDLEWEDGNHKEGMIFRVIVEISNHGDLRNQDLLRIMVNHNVINPN